MNIVCRFCGHPVDMTLIEMPCQYCLSDSLFRFIPEDWPRTFNEVKKYLNMDNRQIAEYFGYKDADSFGSAKSRHDIRQGILYTFYTTMIKKNNIDL